MNFARGAENGENKPVKYLATIAIVMFSFVSVGYLPLSLALVNKNVKIEKDLSTVEMSTILGSNTFFICILIPFIIGLLTLILCVKYIHFRKVLTLFTSRETIDWKRFFFSFFLYGGILTLFFVITIKTSDTLVWNFNPTTFFMLLSISLFILPLQTTFEEAFFRGYLFQGVHTVFKRGGISVLFISILFAAMHYGNPEVEKIGTVLMFYYVMNGIFLGLIVLMDDGLELSMGYHAVNNIFASLIVTNNWQSFQTDALYLDKGIPSFGMENILTLVVVQPLLIFIFSKKYKWTNWREKIIGKKS